MKPVLLLLAATATIGAAPPRPSAPRYWAGGFEPSWSFVIEHGRMIFDPHTGDPVINVPLPRRQPIRNGYRYVTRELSVTVRHVRCDSYDGRTFMDTVRPSLAVEDGCGGTPITAPDVTYAGWTVQYVDGVRLPDPPSAMNLTVGFHEGRITLQARCHTYSGTYRERRPLLRVQAITESWAACPASATERRIVEIMLTPMRMRFIDGDTLVLSNRTGSLRLSP
jgi:heat shock protein HslJ